MFGISLGWSLTIGCEGASAQPDGAQALQTVRSEIRLLEDRLASEQAERDSGLRALKEAELRAAEAAGALRDVREDRASQLAKEQGLREDTRLAGVRIGRERGDWLNKLL